MASNCVKDAEEKGSSANIIRSGEIDLPTGIDEAGVALKLFLNNHFQEAKSRMKPCAQSSMYHSLAYSTVLYIQAVMTFDMADIETAIEATKKAVIVCNKLRKKTSMMDSFSKVTNRANYADYTEEEIHAELCYAECLLLRALLTFIQDENLISFVKGGLKIRECYKCYKDCNKILPNRNWVNEKQRLHFDSGVKMGVGAFNLMISLLPSRVLKLLEFVGFSGNKKTGLTELEKGSHMSDSLRGPLCSIILIAYHTVVSFILGTADGDVDLASELLAPCLRDYPKGALFLFFAGRIEEIRANIDGAIVRYEESIDSQHEWRQFHHLCFWELMWCHCFKFDWLIGMKYAERLCHESRWSKATYTYQKASFLMMCNEQSDETREHVDFLLEEVPRLKIRIAGKSLPIEKFAVKKAARYKQQGGRLTLPAFELIYVWNGFNIIGKKPELLDPFMATIETTLNDIIENKDSYPNYWDDYVLVLLLKGICLKFRGQTFQAEQCFKEIIDNEKRVKLDTYILPYATVEMALLYLLENRLEDVRKLLDRAKHHYHGYLLESRLHFRIHSVRHQLSMMNSDTEASSPPSSADSIGATANDSAFVFDAASKASTDSPSKSNTVDKT